MTYVPRPHMSAALQHMRLSVSACAIALSMALCAQVGVWSMVHFTHVREKQVDADAAPDLRVVQSQPKAPLAASGATPGERQPVDVNTVPSEQDVMLRGVSSLVQTVGVIAGLLLSLLMFQAISIAGGGSIPGVERAVTAGTLTHLIVLLCMPIGAVLVDVPFKGVLSSYGDLVVQSELVRAGGPGAPGAIAYYGKNFILPVTLVVGLIVVILRFRAGIESGVIVTSVSQLDEKIEREIRAARLGQLAAPRAVGALNAALGDEPSMSMGASHVSAPIRPRSVEAVAVAPPAFRSADAHHGESYRPGDSTKRPI